MSVAQARVGQVCVLHAAAAAATAAAANATATCTIGVCCGQFGILEDLLWPEGDRVMRHDARTTGMPPDIHASALRQ